jgi:large subunit ribosomal protein L15
MAHKDRKNRANRGTRTCGWGSSQKHRGAGNRGGRGNAGTQKHKWPHYSKYYGAFGRKGFKRPISQINYDHITNVGYLSNHIEDLAARGYAKKEGDTYTIDLTQTDYTKLLGSGKVDVKLKVKVQKCTQKARQKVEQAGGSVEACETDDTVQGQEENNEQENQ